MKQTAVEWLVEKLKENHGLRIDLYDEFEQAKQMEKNNLYECGSFWRGKENKIEKPFFEQYYNETIMIIILRGKESMNSLKNTISILMS